jgi:hypothetical protein
MFRWVGEREMKAGWTEYRVCPTCSDLPKTIGVYEVFDTVHFRCEIIDCCGEADFAEAVYEAEFRHRIEALT